MSTSQKEARALRNSHTEVLEDEIQRCTGCGICVTQCAFLKLYGTPRDIAGSYDPEDPKKNAVCFECSLCGLCTAVCPEKVDPKALFLEQRREAVDRGYGSFPEHKGLLGYERTGMSRRFSWYGLPQGCTTIFFPGCALPGTRPAATQEVFQRLQDTIPALGLVMDCCTKPSHDLGRQDYFQEMFGEMVAWLEGAGIERVLVACPNCYKVFTQYAPQFQTETVYQVLAEMAPESFGQLEMDPVTIHDPCVVRAASAPQDAVRSILQGAGVTIEEMPHTRSRALCCGEGGSVGALAPDLAASWGERRAAEANGRRVVTYCAGCANHLGKRVQVSHVLDLICHTPKASSGPVTYLNRLRLKSRFKKTVPAALVRERVLPGASGVLRPLIMVAALVAVIVLARVSGIGQYLEPEKLRALFAGFGVVAPLVYIGVFTVAPALMLPGLPISMAGATVFGPVFGVVYTIIGATMGACLAFLIARYGARDWVERKLSGQRWKKLNSETAQNGWKAVAFTRLIPLFPFNLLNFAFGLTKISFLQYAVATFIFMLPGTIAFITFSSSLLGLLKGKVSREFFIGILLIVAVSNLPKLVKWYKSRPEPEARPTVPWSLRKSLQLKAAGLALVCLVAGAGYLLALKYFWAIDAYLYTVEFNLLFVANRLRDANLAGFIEYLRPMSAARAAATALVWQAMQTFAFPFSALPGVPAFTSAFGTLSGALYSEVAALAVGCLAVLTGRVLLGDLLPLYNRGKGSDAMRPAAAWTGWGAALMAAIPGFPLLVCGLWSGGFRLPWLRCMMFIAAGLALRILVSI
jgi:uncharacterized membrane protein YdjX (TVP38/TMEM64 family)/Fe-S oxidoreductase